MSLVSSVPPLLLDHRYRIMAALPGSSGERHFAAWHVELDIPVRIVSLRLGDLPAVDRNGAVKRFWARTAAAVALRHPGMVWVRDCFRQGPAFTVVLDWTPGETLAARLAAHGPLPLREVLALGLHLCDTVGTVAQRAPLLLPLGTLAPETLALLPNGRYILTDPGIRHWLSAHPLCPRDATQPAAREMLELPLDAAPDVSSDLYSVAAILYASLTGTPPAVAGGVLSPLSTLAPTVPAIVSECIERALLPNPADRYATPEAFAVALGAAIQRALPDVSAPTRPSQPLSLPARTNGGISIRHARPRHCSPGSAAAPHLHWPQAWAHGLTRVAAPMPLRRTGERALAAISTALRLGA